MALKRLERDYEETIKHQIKEKDNNENEKKMMMTGDDDDSDNEDEQDNNVYQNYQKLDENDDHNEHSDFGDFEEYGIESNNNVNRNHFDEKKLEFIEDKKDVIEKNQNEDNINNKILNKLEIDTNAFKSYNIETQIKKETINVPKFSELEKEKIKNAMKQINIKPPIWAKK